MFQVLDGFGADGRHQACDGQADGRREACNRSEVDECLRCWSVMGLMGGTRAMVRPMVGTRRVTERIWANVPQHMAIWF